MGESARVLLEVLKGLREHVLKGFVNRDAAKFEWLAVYKGSRRFKYARQNI